MKPTLLLQQDAAQFHAEGLQLTQAIRALLTERPQDRLLLRTLLAAAHAAAFAAGRLATMLDHLHQFNPATAAAIAAAANRSPT